MVDASDGLRPDPGQAADLSQFTQLLGQLRIWAGAPSYRTLAKAVSRLMRPAQTVTHSTIAYAFQPERRRVSLDLVLAIVRALGVDEPGVDQWRTAWMKVHAQARTGGPTGVFRQLPPDLATFTGRAGEIAGLLHSAYSPDSGVNTVVISAIEGMAGVGKTQLAIHVGHELLRRGRFADIQLYVNLRGFDPDHEPADPSAVLDGFLRQLEVPAQQIPPDLDARAAMFRDRMHGRHALMLLDNAADETQVRDLIPASPTCFVLVTSRRSLSGMDGALLHQLDVFTPAEAIDLLTRIVGPGRIADEPEAVSELAAVCGYLPLAISLVAARLRSRATWSVADLVGRLRAGGLGAIQIGKRALQPVFDLSYQGLPGPAQRVLRLLGTYPGVDFTAPLTAALANISPSEAEAILELLLDEHLLEPQGHDRYQFHDLLHAYARELAARHDTADDRSEALRRVVGWFLHTAAAADSMLDPRRLYMRPDPYYVPAHPRQFIDRDAAQNWLDAEAHSFLPVTRSAITLAGAYRAGWQLLFVLWSYFDRRRPWDQWIGSYELAYLATVEKEDLEGQTRVLSNLGLIHWRMGDVPRAIETLERARALNELRGDLMGEAAVLDNLGSAYDELGSPHDAIRCLSRALIVAEKQQNAALQANVLCNLGETYRRLRAYAQAHEHLSQALRIQQQTGDMQQRYTLLTFAELHHDQGDYTPAIEYAARALEVATAIDDQWLMAMTHTQKGASHAADGSIAQAQGSWQQALAIFEQLHDPHADQVRQYLSEAGESASRHVRTEECPIGAE